MDAVEVDDGADGRIGAAGEERELAAHAEADGAELGRRGMSRQVGGRPPQVLLGLLDVERHEELARPIGLTGRLALIHVGRQHREARRGEAVAHRLDMRHQTPPLLDHQSPRSLAGSRRREIPVRRMSIGWKLHHLACHILSFLLG